MPSTEENLQDEKLEKMFYKSSLKQVVTFLNSELPEVSNSEEESDQESIERKRVRRRVLKKTTGMYRVKDSKKIKKAILKEMSGKSERDIKPTRVRNDSNADKNDDKNKGSKTKRFNKYSELKYQDLKKDRKEKMEKDKKSKFNKK